MGCDIHMYTEYRRQGIRKDGKEFSWMSWGKRINPGRNYYLFGLLSKGVRQDIKEGIPPKGLPTNISYIAQHDAYMYIDDEDESCGESSYATTAKAMEWKEKYDCEIQYDHDNKPLMVENPDWHSHTWLSPSEFEKVIEIYYNHPERGEDWLIPEYEALLAAMKVLEKHYEVRVVFWFDN